MRGQLRLWAPVFVDLLAKIAAEAFATPRPPWLEKDWPGITLRR